MSLEYILLSTFERKTVFLAIYKPKHAQNRPFFRHFLYISGSWEGLFDFYNPLHHHPWTGHSLVNSRRGWGMTQSPPLSYWSPEKSHMTSSRTETQVNTANGVGYPGFLLTLILLMMRDM